MSSSSSSGADSSSGSGGPAETGTDSGVPADAAEDVASFDSSPDAGPCAALGMQCFGCCQSTNASGATDYFGYVQACVCGTGPCASLDTCVQGAVSNGGVCAGKVTGQYATDVNCTAYVDCATGCP
jgi:hypothetical protein